MSWQYGKSSPYNLVSTVISYGILYGNINLHLQFNEAGEALKCTFLDALEGIATQSPENIQGNNTSCTRIYIYIYIFTAIIYTYHPPSV